MQQDKPKVNRQWERVVRTEALHPHPLLDDYIRRMTEATDRLMKSGEYETRRGARRALHRKAGLR